MSTNTHSVGLSPEVQEILRAGLARHPKLISCQDALVGSFQTLCETFRSGGKLLVGGNGGSAADGGHIVGELVKGFMLRRPPTDLDPDALEKAFGPPARKAAQLLQRGLPAIDLTAQTPLFTAFCNDVDAEYALAQQVYVYGNPNDAFFGISTSGTSKNVLRALEIAKVRGLRTLLLTGPNEGPADVFVDHVIHVPGEVVYEIQELHLPVYHLLCLMLEVEFFGGDS